MMINNCHLIPCNGFSSGGVQFARSWQTEVRQALSGHEDRQSLRSRPLRRLPFQITARNLSELAQLKNLLDAGLRSGRVAVPLWGRGQAIAAATSGAELTLDPEAAYPFTPGEWVFIVETCAWRWEVAQLDSVASLTSITLDSGLSESFPIGSIVYPILFGKLSVESVTPISPVASQFELVVEEPLGKGALLDSESACPAGSESFTTGNRTFCEGSLTITLVAGCGGYRELNWDPLGYADRYEVRYAFNSGGPYTLLDTTQSSSATVPRWLQTPVFYVVAAISGSTEIISNEIDVDPITIEACLRAFQERHVVGHGALVAWPSVFEVGAVSPPAYPVDGWYDADLIAGGAPREVALIQGLIDLFFDTQILQAYVDLPPETLLEDYPSGTTLPYFEDPDTLSRRDPFPDTPPTVNEATRLDDLRQLADWFCVLNYLPITYYPLHLYQVDEVIPHARWIFSEYDLRQALVIPSDACSTPTECAQLLHERWDLATWNHSSSHPGAPFSAGTNAWRQITELPGGSEVCIGEMKATRYRFQSPMSDFGVARLYLFQALTTELGEPPLEAGQNPPGKVDLHFHSTALPVELPVIGGEYESGYQAGSKPTLPDTLNLETIWNLYEAILLVEKRGDDWTHFA